MLTLQKITKGIKFARSFSYPSVATNFNDIKSENLEIHLTKNPKEKPDPENLPFAKIMSDHMLVIEWYKGFGWGTPIIKSHGNIMFHPGAGVLQYGSQIYEGMKAFYGVDHQIRMFRPNLNMERFWDSAKRMSLPTFDKNELLNCVQALVSLEKEWVPRQEGKSLYIRPTLVGLDPMSDINDIQRALLFVITSPSGPYFPGGKMRPISLLADPQHVRSWVGGVGHVKAGGNYGPTLYLQNDAMKKDCDQVLWLYNDQVTEAGGMNIFVHWLNENGDEELMTAPLNGLILPGITRKSCMEIASQWDNILVTEREFTIQDVVKASHENRIKHMFACGTACVICPINRILYQPLDDTSEELTIPYDMSDDSLMMRLYNELQDIQFGKTEHPWVQFVY